VVSPIFMAAPGIGVPSYAEPIEESETDRLRKDIAAQLGGAFAEGGPLDVVIDVGQPASRILERAASLPADLIVMGTHGTSGFEHLVLGSVTEKRPTRQANRLSSTTCAIRHPNRALPVPLEETCSDCAAGPAKRSGAVIASPWLSEMQRCQKIGSRCATVLAPRMNTTRREARALLGR
jgi:hypothetical protein